MRYLLLCLMLVLAGCTTAADNTAEQQISWETSPVFTTEGVSVQGEQGRIAVANQPIVSGKQQTTTWYFWGTSDEITGKLAIIGYSKETGKSQPLVDKIYTIPAKPKDGADNHENLRVHFPNKGLWKLDVFIDQRPFGSIVLEVK